MRTILETVRSTGDKAKGENDLAALQVADPTFSLGWLNLGILEQELGKSDKSIQCFEHVLEIEKGSDLGVEAKLRASLARNAASPEYRMALGLAQVMALREQRLSVEALGLLERIAPAFPNAWEVSAIRASLLAELEQFSKSGEAYAKALALAPAEMKASLNRGLAQLHFLEFAHQTSDAALALEAKRSPGAAEAMMHAWRLRPMDVDLGMSAAASAMASGDRLSVLEVCDALRQSNSKAVRAHVSSTMEALGKLSDLEAKLHDGPAFDARIDTPLRANELKADGLERAPDRPLPPVAAQAAREAVVRKLQGDLEISNARFDAYTRHAQVWGEVGKEILSHGGDPRYAAEQAVANERLARSLHRRVAVLKLAVKFYTSEK